MLRTGFKNIGYRYFSIFNQQHPFIKVCKESTNTVETHSVGKPYVGNPEDRDLLEEYMLHGLEVLIQ